MTTTLCFLPITHARPDMMISESLIQIAVFLSPCSTEYSLYIYPTILPRFFFLVVRARFTWLFSLIVGVRIRYIGVVVALQIRSKDSISHSQKVFVLVLISSA